MAANLETLPVPVPLQAENVPALLRSAKRWVAWRASWDDGKFNKKPGRIDRPGAGLKDWTTTGWTDFESAMRAYESNRHIFGGVGYVLTDQREITAVDLDHCVGPDGTVAEWAQEIVAKLDSYTEYSPSGTGLHVFLTHRLEEDWQEKRDSGLAIEVYGAGKRFLTVTGAMYPGAPKEIRPQRDLALDRLKARYYKRNKSADVEDLHLPHPLDEDDLPPLHELDLPPSVRNFLSDGPTSVDRSRELFATSVGLGLAGLDRLQIFSILANNEHALALAEDKWKGSYEKALRYLWKHSAGAGVARAEGLRQELVDSFQTIDEVEALDDLVGLGDAVIPASTGTVADDFDNLDDTEGPDPRGRDTAPIKKQRFNLMTPGQFLHRKPAEWLVRDLLPRAGLVVVYGDSGSGKSFFMLDVTMAIARGADWRGRPVAKGRVVYVVAEGATGFAKRFQAYCEHHGLDPETVDIHFLADSFSLATSGDATELLKTLQTLGRLDMVVIDTYARVMAGSNENDAKDVGEAVKQCDKLHRGTGALIVLVHHSGKDATKGARGSGALRAAADAEIQVVKTREYRAATITKMKDGADDAEYQFRLHETVLGTDAEGFLITSCVVEQRENQARRVVVEKPLTRIQQIVLNTLGTVGGLTGDASLHFTELKRLAVEAIPRDPTKKKDNRHRDAGNAIEALVLSGELKQDESGMIERAELPNV